MAKKVAKKTVKKSGQSGAVKQSNLNSTGVAREINKTAQVNTGIKPGVKSGNVKGANGGTGSNGASGL